MVHILNYIKKNKLLWPILLAGFVAHMALVVFNGLTFCYHGKCGIYFFGVHGFDTIWHLSLSAVSFSSFPFIVPNYVGAALHGYNYLMDLVVFPFVKLGISNLFIYFRLLPFLWFVFFTYSLIRFGLLIHKSPKFIGLLLFLSYFTGSFAYLLTLWHRHSLQESSSLVAIQSLHALANMQFAFSLIFLLEILIIIKRDTFTIKDAFLLAIFTFLNIGLKFYGGVITLFLVGLYTIFKLFPLSKESINVVKNGGVILLAALASIFIFYDPFTSANSAGLFTFDPLATVHPIIEWTKLLYLPKLVEVRYALHNKIGPRLVAIESFTILAFLFFNYGIRLVGILYILKKTIQRKMSQWEVLVFLTILFATLLDMLFVQKGEWWNTVQFLYYGIFLANLFAAIALYKLIQTKKVVLIAVAFGIIVVSLPMDFDLMYQFLNPEAMSYLPTEEVQALHVLKKAPYGTVYVPIFNPDVMSRYGAPLPMYMYYDTPYIPAFSGKPVYYSTSLQLRLLGINYEGRVKAIKNGDCRVTKEIDYAYIVSADSLDSFFRKCIDATPQYRRIFENKGVVIYQKTSLKSKS